ncbi:uncharacterized protein LOC110018605 isoform X1 [Phalaenopsis equestris]|uniref:uncharacterized protein LOC110018605 isoform X1 n=1 Tax=Phalaenopsis equestris TaxID=78828 RepID=UPI0009E60E87|nr:uncharacterized protein LOC110018605 isoform X1 [Phalaenopsis equestris]XP_020571626.1 uncharacterized protein LOC110018605 isoform X1 [Phalaenopsis equestris]
MLYYTEERLHDFHNHIVLSDVYILQRFLQESSNLMKFHSLLDLLSYNALGLLAKLITEDAKNFEGTCPGNFEGTCPGIKIFIKNHFSNDFSAAKGALVATLEQLYEMLKSPENYNEKQPNVMTPASSALPSIHKGLELLHSMPLFALIALNRKLKSKKTIFTFPPSKIGYNKNKLVNSIQRRCQKLILTLNNENSMPKELAKVISTIHLYFKYKTKCSYTFTTNFFSFSIETVTLQNDILKALWSIPKITSDQMKALQAILGVKLEDDSSSFLNDLKQYLMQYLLECDEIKIPSAVSDVLAVLNQSPSNHPQTCSKEMIEVEMEAVLNVSVGLYQIVSHFVSCMSTDEKAEVGLESYDDTMSNDFELIENACCSSIVKYGWQRKNDLSMHGELDSTGDSMPQTCRISANSDSCSKNIKHDFVKKVKKEQDDDIDDQIPHYKKSMEASLRSTQAPKDCRDISIKELCDETSLVSYRLIGHMLNSFLLVKGEDVGVTTRYHLTGEVLHSTIFEDKKDVLGLSGENVGIKALMHSVKDLLPSMPERCMQRVEKLMKQPTLIN